MQHLVEVDFLVHNCIFSSGSLKLDTAWGLVKHAVLKFMQKLELQTAEYKTLLEVNHCLKEQVGHLCAFVFQSNLSLLYMRLLTSLSCA
jgi:hypothetical protein